MVLLFIKVLIFSVILTGLIYTKDRYFHKEIELLRIERAILMKLLKDSDEELYNGFIRIMKAKGRIEEN